jgi:hypothetical protein
VLSYKGWFYEIQLGDKRFEGLICDMLKTSMLYMRNYGHSQERQNWGGGRRGSRPRCPLPGGARGAKVPFQFKGLPWRNSELSEMLVQFFYGFASENARNAVIELQE